jgi:hypothetical protein
VVAMLQLVAVIVVVVVVFVLVILVAIAVVLVVSGIFSVALFYFISSLCLFQHWFFVKCSDIPTQSPHFFSKSKFSVNEHQG